MSNAFFGVAVDCADAAALAQFWAQVLGRKMATGPTREHAVVLVDDDGTQGPRVAFHQVPEEKTVKNRLHLDLISTDFDAESERLLSLGAGKIRELEQGGARWTSSRCQVVGAEMSFGAGGDANLLRKPWPGFSTEALDRAPWNAERERPARNEPTAVGVGSYEA